MTAAIEAPSLAWIALGGNLGDACQSVQQAIAAPDCYHAFLKPCCIYGKNRF